MGLECHYEIVPYIVLGLVLLFPFIVKSKSSFYHNGKFAVFYVTTTVIGVLLLPLFLLSPRNIDNVRRSCYFTKHIASWIGVRFELRNGEILAKQRGAVVVSNHQSSLDILGQFNIWHVPYKVAIIAKKELLYAWPFGMCAWLAGVVFIDRSSAASAYKTLQKTSNLTNTDKAKLWLFPEGTRNMKAIKTRKLLDFKRGAFKMAVHCQVPIIPVVYSPYYFLNQETGYFGEGTIIIRTLPPIETKGLGEDDVNDLMERTKNVMQNVYNELFDEVTSNLPKSHPFFETQT